MYLPDALLRGRREPAPASPYRNVSAAQAGNYWACYAWPVSYEGTGKRAYFVNQSGQILVCANDRTRYSGDGNYPFRRAALAPGSPITMNGRLAINMIGYDGNFWRVLN